MGELKEWCLERQKETNAKLETGPEDLAYLCGREFMFLSLLEDLELVPESSNVEETIEYVRGLHEAAGETLAMLKAVKMVQQQPEEAPPL